MAWPNHKPPSGMPATGAGWGGPARVHPKNVFATDNQPLAEHKRLGKMERAEYQAHLKAKREKTLKVYDRVLTLAETSSEPQMLMAGLRVSQIINETLDGRATQPIGGPDGGAIPTSLAITFVAPDASRQRED